MSGKASRYSLIIPHESQKLEDKKKQQWTIQRDGEILDEVNGTLRDALRSVSRFGKGAVAVDANGQTFEPY